MLIKLFVKYIILVRELKFFAVLFISFIGIIFICGKFLFFVKVLIIVFFRLIFFDFLKIFNIFVLKVLEVVKFVKFFWNWVNFFLIIFIVGNIFIDICFRKVIGGILLMCLSFKLDIILRNLLLFVMVFF